MSLLMNLFLPLFFQHCLSFNYLPQSSICPLHLFIWIPCVYICVQDALTLHTQSKTIFTLSGCRRGVGGLLKMPVHTSASFFDQIALKLLFVFTYSLWINEFVFSAGVARMQHKKTGVAHYEAEGGNLSPGGSVWGWNVGRLSPFHLSALFLSFPILFHHSFHFGSIRPSLPHAPCISLFGPIFLSAAFPEFSLSAPRLWTDRPNTEKEQRRKQKRESWRFGNLASWLVGRVVSLGCK